MRFLVYGLYNSYLDVYETPQVYTFGDSEENLREGFRRLILSNPDKAFADRFNEKELCLYGTFDDRSGVFDLLDHPQRLVHLASFFPQGYLAKKESNNG